MGKQSTHRAGGVKEPQIEVTLTPLTDGTSRLDGLKVGDPNKRYWELDEKGAVCWQAYGEPITIPDGVSVIGRLRCQNLGEVILPPTVRELGDLAFGAEFYTGDTYEWYALHTVHFSQGLRCIGYRAFCNCRNLDGVHLPKGLERIEDGAFYLCLSLSRITIPESVETIGTRAFGKCPALREVIFRDGIRATGGETFLEDEGLTKVILPKTLERIGSECFFGCKSLPAIDIPESVTSIGGYAFRDCTALAAFTFVRDLENAEEMRKSSPFAGCTALSEFHLTAAVSRADWIPTAPALTAIKAAPNHPLFTTVDGILFSKDKKTLLRMPAGRSGEYTIPRGVTAIAPYAFFGCSALSAVHLPSTLLTIGEGAFEGCVSLTSIKLHPKIKKVEKRAFANCTALQSASIGAARGSIAETAFLGCTALKSNT